MSPEASTGSGFPLEREIERPDPEDAEQGERPAPCAVDHDEARMLAWLQVDFEVAPEQRVVSFEPVRAGRNVARRLLPVEKGSEGLAVYRYDDLSIPDIGFVAASDGNPGWFGHVT